MMPRIETLEELETLLGVDLSAYADQRPGHRGLRLDSAVRAIIAEIGNGSPGAAMTAFAIVERDPHLPFGKIIKSNIARAFRKRPDLLADAKRTVLIRKTAELLSMQFCPREVEDYCKLIKTFGPAAIAALADAAKPRDAKSIALIERLAGAPRSTGAGGAPVRGM